MKKSLLSTAVIAALLPLPSVADTLLEEVVITASRNETPIRQVGASVSVIDQDAITLANYPSLVDLMRTQVGLTSSNSGGPGKASSLRIRGEEGYRTLILVDGVDISDPTGTQVGPQVQYLSNSGDVERIEILRGPQGFAYGADAGGVINIFSRSVDEGATGQVSLESGKYGTQNIDGFVAAGSKNADFFLSASEQDTDGFNSRTSDTTMDADGYNNQTVHTKIGANNADDSLRFQLVARDVSATNEFDNCGYYAEDFSYTRSNDCSGHFDQTTARASLDYNQQTYSISVGAAGTQVERDSFAEDIETFATQGDTQKFDLVATTKIAQSLTLVGGADNKKEKVKVANGDDLSRNQLGVFSELQMNLDDSLYFSAGARFDDNDDFGKHTSYRFTSAYVNTMGEQSYKLRASLGTGFRAPSLSEIAYNDTNGFGLAANTDLQEEQSQGYDIGFDLFFSNDASIEATFFSQKIENEIFFDLVDYSGYLQNNAESHSKGVEIAVNYPLSESLVFSANATYNQTKTRGDLQRTRRPERSTNFGVVWSHFNDKLKARANYRVAKGLVDEIYGLGRVALNNYQILDISASYEVVDGLTIFGRFDNALNEDYVEITGYNTSGLAGYAGVRLTF